jgi:hypothetical protein
MMRFGLVRGKISYYSVITISVTSVNASLREWRYRRRGGVGEGRFVFIEGN